MDATNISALADLAISTEARVHVLQLRDGETDRLARALSVIGKGRDLAERVSTAVATQQADLADALADRGIAVSRATRSGRPFIETIQEAMAIGADLLAVPSATATPAGPFELHLMRKAPCPVWLMRSGQRGVNRILCAGDPDLEDQQRMGLADSTLRLARSLAEYHGAALSVLHCWQLDEISSLRSSGFLSIPEEEIASIQLAAESDAQARLDALVSAHALDRIGAEIILDQGRPDEAIPRMAEIISADLVVMGTVGRAGIPGLFIGNTAEAVLGRLTSSVLAVKPEGFTSPVPPRGPAGNAAVPTQTLLNRVEAAVSHLAWGGRLVPGRS